jgi:pyridine nucleotide-disulfide oxidoreductase family protein
MRRLLLLGGGHAHVKVLADLAERPLADWQVHLVSPYRRQIYSGMLPGWVAGHYPIEACAIALDALAARAGVVFHETAGAGLDLSRQRVLCADGSALDFDLLTIDTGPVPALQALPGIAEHALPLRPIEAFIAAWPQWVERMLGRCRRFDLVILGAGAAGVELAFAVQHRASVDGWSHLFVTLVGADELPLPGAPPAMRAQAARLLAQRRIAWAGGRRVARLDAGTMHFDDGATLAFDTCLAATGAAAPAWPAQGGLATDAQGFIRVGATLQSLSHPRVLAAGDVAAYADERPKSGVFAVRAGPVLAHNLRALCEARLLVSWTPQARALYLISTGERHALASWGRWSWHGRWVWHWKDRIDRRFMQRFGCQPFEHLVGNHDVARIQDRMSPNPDRAAVEPGSSIGDMHP